MIVCLILEDHDRLIKWWFDDMISYHVMWSTYNGLKYCNSGLSQRAFYYFYYPYILYPCVCWLHCFSFVSTSGRSPVQTVYVSRPAIDNSGRSLGGGLLSTSTNSQVVSFTMMIFEMGIYSKCVSPALGALPSFAVTCACDPDLVNSMP